MKKKIKINEEQENLLRGLAKIIAQRGFASPVIFLLESMQPLNYIISQIMAYAEPFATFLVNEKNYNNIIAILEQREGIDYFLTILEDEENIRLVEQKKRKAVLKDIKKMKKVAKKDKKSFLQKLKGLKK
ncbi:MAG: hypothetical protein CR982_03010 [Candidatus Cloacimonadota bacterium]|nr:MAG: hypothetical protein CR982_03010 [Candidatus Cloacimonadota bacterium]